MLGVPKRELRWLKTCLSAKENIVRLESFNFCIDLTLPRYGQILAYIRCVSTLFRLIGLQDLPSDAMRAFMTVDTFLRCF